MYICICLLYLDVFVFLFLIVFCVYYFYVEFYTMIYNINIDNFGTCDEFGNMIGMIWN